MAAPLLVVTLLAGAVLAAQAPRPLPDYDAFVAATRDNLSRSQREQSRFAYKERRTEFRRNPFGRIGSGVVEGFDVTPVDNGAAIVRRLIERDGKPVINGEVERIDRSQRRTRSTRKSGMEDVVGVLTFAFSHRETTQGRDVIVVHFTPRENASPETREGRMARVFKGSIWVDEAAREVIRVEATAIDEMSFGLGFLARLNQGTTVTLTREAIDGATWLPTSIRFAGQGRALLFRKLVVDQRIDWFDYRRVN
ncbi:MAG TPA: hypothetical protein VI485_07520 [Vicinamibacterales bacterium]|nr:hypothetical protein [Vicinamibacterales bacterium]